MELATTLTSFITTGKKAMVIKRQVFTICDGDRFKLKMVKDNFWATTIVAPSLSKLSRSDDRLPVTVGGAGSAEPH